MSRHLMLCLFVVLLGVLSVACGGGGGGTAVTDDQYAIYDRKAGDVTYVSAMEGDYSDEVWNTPTAGDGMGAGQLDGAAPPENSYSRENSPTVESKEPDLYEIVGDTMYLVNPYRGLFTIDISDPLIPQVLDNLPFRGSPKDMYILDGVVLVVLDSFIHLDPESDEPIRTSAIVKADVSDPADIELIATLPLGGSVTDSRLAGGYVYVITGDSMIYGPMFARDGKIDFTGMGVVSISVDSLTIVDDFELPGWTSVVQAEEGWLAVASSEWYENSTVSFFRFQESGTLGFAGSVTVPGAVGDKFKIHFSDWNAFVISHSWAEGGLSYFSSYDLDGNAPELLARIDLAYGEQQFASRFDDPLCYLITFEQVDPLWVIDYSNPAAPVVADELIVPGWSVFLQPDGDRLIAVGYNNPEDRAIVVTLFDVSDPTDVGQMSQVSLGEQWGWSPVGFDEKSFSLFNTEGLITVPVGGWGYEEGNSWYSSRLWLIDYDGESLARRGNVPSEHEWRRSFMFNGTLGLFTDAALYMADISDRDNPAVEAMIPLAREVRDVQPVTGGYRRVTTGENIVRVEAVEGADPNALANATLELPRCQYYDSFWNGETGYIFVTATGEDWVSTLTLVVVTSVSGIPTKAGELELPYDTYRNWYLDAPMVMPWYGGWGQLIQIAPDLMAMKTSNFGGVMPMYADLAPEGATERENLLLIDLSNAAQPRISARIGLPFGTGEPHPANGKLHFTFWNDNGYDFANHRTVKHRIVTVDPTDRDEPTVSDPINTPGRLLAVRGNTLYCLEAVYGRNNTFKRLLNTANLTGTTATLLDSIEVPDTLWSLTVGSQGDLVAGVERSEYYYYDVYYTENFPGGGANGGGEVAIGLPDAQPAEPGNGAVGSPEENWRTGSKLWYYDTSDPSNIALLGNLDLASHWAEINSIHEPNIFVTTDWQIIAALELTGSTLELVDYGMCGWFSDKMRVSDTQALLPAGMFGILYLDLD